MEGLRIPRLGRIQNVTTIANGCEQGDSIEDAAADMPDESLVALTARLEIRAGLEAAFDLQRPNIKVGQHLFQLRRTVAY